MRWLHESSPARQPSLPHLFDTHLCTPRTGIRPRPPAHNGPCLSSRCSSAGARAAWPWWRVVVRLACMRVGPFSQRLPWPTPLRRPIEGGVPGRGMVWVGWVWVLDFFFVGGFHIGQSCCCSLLLAPPLCLCLCLCPSLLLQCFVVVLVLCYLLLRRTGHGWWMEGCMHGLAACMHAFSQCQLILGWCPPAAGIASPLESRLWFTGASSSVPHIAAPAAGEVGLCHLTHPTVQPLAAASRAMGLPTCSGRSSCQAPACHDGDDGLLEFSLLCRSCGRSICHAMPCPSMVKGFSDLPMIRVLRCALLGVLGIVLSNKREGWASRAPPPFRIGHRSGNRGLGLWCVRLLSSAYGGAVNSRSGMEWYESSNQANHPLPFGKRTLLVLHQPPPTPSSSANASLASKRCLVQSLARLWVAWPAALRSGKFGCFNPSHLRNWS